MPEHCEVASEDADELVEPAIALVAQWLEQAKDLETRNDRATMRRLGDLVADTDGTGFVMSFVDRVARPDSNNIAAKQLSTLTAGASLPKFLSAIDTVMLRVGAKLAPKLPDIVMPLAKRRMKSIVGHLVAPSAPDLLERHLANQRNDGYSVNVNLLGEAVLGEREARARRDELISVLAVPGVDYVSVKLSAVASQLNHWAYDASLERVVDRLSGLLDVAGAQTPPTFINFDMEEYHDLEMTVAAFKTVLSGESRHDLDAGIVLQAYLPDVFDILCDLVKWANDRHAKGGGTIKIRLVKGANLAMEKVDAAIHGWEQAPFESKLESDASYRRCVDWAMHPERLAGVRIGLASHNLFDVAWARLIAERRGVSDRVQFEMLQGMASGQAKAVNATAVAGGHPSMLLYTPAVSNADFDVAIGYLFRRLEENAAPENFMRALFDLNPGSPAFIDEAEFFRQGVELRGNVQLGPARTQDRSAEPVRPPLDQSFVNEPDTDPSLGSNRQWIIDVSTAMAQPCTTPITVEAADLAAAVAVGQSASKTWREFPAARRRELMHGAGHALARRRGELITTMMHEASKTFAEADAEVSEAIDFARWYGDRCVELDHLPGAAFEPLGLIAVVPPWNFPTAIPAGGVLAALASGNAAILKPAPETPRSAELVAEACWAAGIPSDVLQFIRTPDNQIGRQLIESVDAVILTGSSETADLFRSWKPTLRLFAETSGKNALIITPSADLDLAVSDLVQSAFGHAGQKCSAASLAILVGDVYQSDRFRRQLVDAVESLNVGPSLDLDTDVAALVGGGNPRLDKAALELTSGERWLVAPRRTQVAGRGDYLSPSIREGVRSGSWFHTTECFGPMLGLMAADDLDHAIAIANSSDFGLTGGIHTLDPAEVERWAEQIEVGNGYVNRPITGAIVQRQPFGGWKRSSVGPGAKAGGPNYLMQLGHWRVTPVSSDDALDDNYGAQWATHFSVAHDETALFCEANVFRYHPLGGIGLRLGAGAEPAQIALAKKAAKIAGARTHESDEVIDGGLDWLDKLHDAGIERVRCIGVDVTDEMASRASALGIHLATQPVTPSGRIELQHYVREQAISITTHRFGNLVGATPALTR